MTKFEKLARWMEIGLKIMEESQYIFESKYHCLYDNFTGHNYGKTAANALGIALIGKYKTLVEAHKVFKASDFISKDDPREVLAQLLEVPLDYVITIETLHCIPMGLSTDEIIHLLQNKGDSIK